MTGQPKQTEARCEVIGIASGRSVVRVKDRKEWKAAEVA